MAARPFSTASLDPALVDRLTALVAGAGAAILNAGAPALIATKPDQSPFTSADKAADAILCDGLAALVPGLAIVSEERVGQAKALDLDRDFALIDPLDGTKELLNGRSEYTVNLALMSRRSPVAGFIAVPAMGLIYRGIIGRGGERLAIDKAGNPTTAPEPITVRRRPSAGLTATVSRSHLDPATKAFLDRLPVSERQVCGSALKFCRIAEGAADVYPRLGPTFEWDIAAGHAIVAAAGGTVTTAAGTPLTYGRTAAGFAVDDFIAWGDPSAAKAAF